MFMEAEAEHEGQASLTGAFVKQQRYLHFALLG